MKKAIFSYARMPEEALQKFKNELDKLKISIVGTAAHSGEQEAARNIFTDAKLHCIWANYTNEANWIERFDKNLYDQILKDHYGAYLPIVERYRLYNGGSIISETRLMHDFSIAHNMINSTSPDLILFAKSPESGIEICLYEIAKSLGITTYFTRKGLFNHTRYFASDIWAPILDEDWNVVPSIISTNNNESNLSERSHRFVKEIRGADQIRVPKDIQLKGVKLKKSQKIKVDLPFSIKNYFKRKKQFRGVKYLKDLYKYSESLAYKTSSVDWSKTNYFFPLHYQPELTSMPSGKEFVNQLKIIKLISDHLSDNEQLLIKDHPLTFSQRMKTNSKFRNKEFYRWINMMPHVKYLCVEENTLNLINRSDGVITIRGTAGMEAMIKGKPVLVFGNPVYLNGPSIIRHNQSDDITSTLNNFRCIMNHEYNEDDVFDFIKKLESYAMVFEDEYEREINNSVLNQKIYIEVLIEGLNKISYNC